MPRVRVKVPSEPKIVEWTPDTPVEAAPPQPVIQQPVPQAIEQPAAPEPPSPPELQESYPQVTPAIQGAPRFSPRAVVALVVGITIISLFGVGIAKNHGPDDPKGTLGANTSGQSEEQQYYNEVSRIVELPDNQLPRVVNISDAELVKKDNVALGDIKNGDKMLFFTQARKVVVYRPTTKKIIAVVSLAQPTSGQTQTTPTPKK